MADSDVSVRFGADTSGVQTGATSVKGALAGIQEAVASVGAAFKGMGASAVAGFKEVAAGAEGASTSLKEMRDVGLEVRESFRGIGEALVAAFAVHEVADLAKDMAGTAEQTQHVATTFDLTTDQVQRLRAEAAGLGVPFESFTNAMQREDKALTTAREGSKATGIAFRDLGINIKEPIDNATLLQETIAGLANISDVPTRLGLAVQLFGRNIQDIGPLIGATKEQLEAISASTDKYGAVNKTAQEAGLRLADAFNLQKIEMLGLGNTLTAELAPELTQLVEDITGLLEAFRKWASQGNNLRDAVRNLAIAAGALALVLGAGALTAAVEGLAALLSGVFLGAIQVATLGMVEFDAAADANPIGAVVLAVAALAAGFVYLTGKTEAQATADRDLANAQSDELAITDQITTMDDKASQAALKVAMAKLAEARGRVENARAAALEANQANQGGNITGDIYGAIGQSEAAGAADDANSALTTESETLQKVSDEVKALVGHINDLKTAGPPTIPSLGKGGKGADETAAKNDSIQLLHELEEQAAQQEKELDEEVLRAEEDHENQRRTAIKETLDATIKANDQDLADTKAAIAEKETALKAQLDQGATSQRAYWNGLEILQRQETDAEIANAKANTAAQADALRQDMALKNTSITQFITDDMALFSAETSLTKQIAKLWSDLFKQITTDQTQQLKQFQTQWNSFVNPMVEGFTKGLLDMAQGTKNFGQIWRAFQNEMLQDSIQVIDKIVEKFLWSTVAQAAAQKLGITQQVAAQQAGASQQMAISGMTALKQVTNSAVKAAGEAYSALAGIPVIGPALGAGAAAVTFAAVEAFGAMVASAAGGYDIPAGVNPITQLHAQEMVLPARLANPMRDLLSGFGPAGSADSGAGSNGGDTHIHNWHIHAMDGQDVYRTLTNNKGHVAKAFQSFARGGVNTGFQPA